MSTGWAVATGQRKEQGLVTLYYGAAYVDKIRQSMEPTYYQFTHCMLSNGQKLITRIPSGIWSRLYMGS